MWKYVFAPFGDMRHMNRLQEWEDYISDHSAVMPFASASVGIENREGYDDN